MKFDYTEIAADVIEIIEEFGRSLALTSPGTGGEYDPVLGGTVGGTGPTSRDVQGITLDITEEYSASVGGNNIQSKDQLIYMMPAEPAPTLQNSVFFDDKSWNVVNMVTVKPALTPVLYILQVRP